jgi:hypothetical protein
VLWRLGVSLIALALLAACGGNDRTPAGTSTSPTSATTVAVAPATQGPRTGRWIDLQVGDCVSDLPAIDLGVVTVTIVDCATPHAAEVYLRAPLAVNTAIADVAEPECVAGFPQYTGQPVDGSPYTVTYLIDSDQNRTSSNPAPSTVICLLQAANGGPLTGSARR